MKASKFAGFFGLKVTRKDHIDEEYSCKRFILTDEHGRYSYKDTFHIDGLAYCFNEMLAGFIDAPLSKAGFVYDEKRKKSRYNQALEYLKGRSEYKDLYYVINCLNYPYLIRDDISPKGIPFYDPKLFLEAFFQREIPKNVIRAIESRENTSIVEIAKAIATLPEFQIEDCNGYYSIWSDMRNHTEFLEMTVENIHSLYEKAKEQNAA